MTKFIYLSLQWLSGYDRQLLLPNYQYSKWFKLHQAEHWPRHTTSRVHLLDTPWPLAPTVCPIPKIIGNELRFDVVIEEIAEEFCRQVTESNKDPYICWSGGIDSTSILVSILKVATAEFLERVTILCSDKSVTENSYFYYKFIDKKLKTQNIDTFEITADNYDKIIVVDGEAGNQIMGQTAIHKLIYSGQHDLLNAPWKNIVDLKKLLIGATDFNIELICESLKHSPIDIETGYDLLWWTNFNFKFDEVLLRKTMSYTEQLTNVQSKTFFTQSLYKFYAHPKMQIWSMLSKDLRRETSSIISKYIPKKYIFDFDNNDFYFSSKCEEGSLSDVFFNKDIGSKNSAMFAIDEEWHRYNINHADSRRMLGAILHKI
jgi:hypothetical protein